MSAVHVGSGVEVEVLVMTTVDDVWVSVGNVSEVIISVIVMVVG